MLANTLRIIFWFGKRFETPLLVQVVKEMQIQPLGKSFKAIFPFTERPHELGNVRPHPPLRLHQQQGGYFTSSCSSIPWQWHPHHFGALAEDLCHFGVKLTLKTYMNTSILKCALISLRQTEQESNRVHDLF